MRDLIIIGAGPAGLAAALYATRKRMDCLVISKDLGGKSNYAVRLADSEGPGAIRADELVTIYKSRLQYLRHSHRLAEVKRLTASGGTFTCALEDDSTEEARAVIVATGTRLRRLGVPGEKQFLSRGLGYSSISYSHLFAGKRVVLVGDADRVLDSTLELSIHADAVTTVLLAGGWFSEDLVARARDLERVTILEEATVREFRGDEYAREVVLASKSGEQTIAADGFFVELAPEPNTDFIGDGISLESTGSLRVDGTNSTAVPGLFAAGDVTGNGYEQILVSLGEGSKAALSAYRYLLETGRANA